ncbi:ABC transporter permease [Sporosarcina trichiuri]|uniref:ABC transporter permease n=1 Tax=Sporosarcina trichiuri TaxID=3056445 RepID=UPI0025B40CDD|nr:ABC transporter permease [Sporosarcina sp. 0.2-SM1T-5]WJY27320.1 ABC transporter permease [Sporosarcina sp. 0.2-SM1T-5]
MTLSFKRIHAIFMKDYKDFSRNLAVSIIIFLPPVLAAFFSRMGTGGTIETHYMVINMSFAMVAAFVQSCLIAEEKEKNTLRGLMLSPASTSEILIGKSLLSLSLTLVSIVLSLLLGDYRPANIGIITVAILVSSVFYIALGTMLGLFAKTVMEASLYVTPVFVLFSFGTLLPAFAEQYPVLKAATYLPNIQLLEIGIAVENGTGMTGVLPQLAIILAWGIAASLAAISLYKQRLTD